MAKHGESRYHWIDPVSGQPTPPPPTSVMNKELLLQDSDVRKVRLQTRQNEDLGFSIRGGLEHELGEIITLINQLLRMHISHLYGNGRVDTKIVPFMEVPHL